MPRPREVYFPNSESLAPDEKRVIACGTGMPTTRASQAAACFLVELGNGDKFLFDIGSGSAERISSLQMPYDYLDKVFIGHLHGDHFGAIGELFIGGALMGRVLPLRIWGPSGPVPELGTAYAIEKMEEMYTWDLAGRAGLVDFRGYKTEVHEFDYKGVNQVVYENNGVTVRSFPAIHSLDGPVSFSLEWSGLKFVFGSDTYPNKWFAKYAKDADLVVHECFIAVPDLVAKMRFTPEQALLVGTQVHTAPGGLREGHERREAANGGGLPLLQGFRHYRRDQRPHSYDLRWAVEPRRGLHGLEHHQGRDHHSYGGRGGGDLGAARHHAGDSAQSVRPRCVQRAPRVEAALL
jgi:ribonuclease Z